MASGNYPRPTDTAYIQLTSGTSRSCSIESGSYLFYSFSSYATLQKISMLYVSSNGTVTIRDIYAYATDNVVMTTATNSLTVENTHASATASIYIQALQKETPLPIFN